jgi:hypothetical protein
MIFLPIIFLILAAGAMVASMLFMPKRRAEPPKTNSLEIPTTEAGVPIKVIFGRRRITDPHVVWYGDVRVKKVKVNQGSKKK